MSEIENPQIEHVAPILSVRSVAKSIDHYVNVLGFKECWNAGAIGEVSREKLSIMFTRQETPNPGLVWVGVEDVQLFHDEYKASGATFRHELKNFSWAYQIEIEDPDGNVLRIGSEPLSDQPFEDQ